MTGYKEAMRKRQTISIATTLLLTVAVIVVFVLDATGVGLGHTSDFIHGMQAGMLTGFLAVAVLMTMRYTRACRDEAALKKLYIAETDERNRYIRDKIGGIGMNLTIALLAIVTIVTGYFDQTAFFTLMATTVGVALIKAALKLVFARKI